MIHEYALEPKLVASWHDRHLCRYLIEQFGYGTGRVVSRYPNKWAKLVWKSFDANVTENKDIKHKRLEVLLKKLCGPQVRRHGSVYLWKNTYDWLKNAEEENERRPFHAILSSDNPRSTPNVLRVHDNDDFMEEPPKTWPSPSSIVVERTAASMAEAVRPMLNCASRIVFVDPYFRATRAKYRNPLRQFLQLVRTDLPPVMIQVHASADNAPSWGCFKKNCESHLPVLVPAGLALSIYFWKSRDNGEQLHNRYILTDVGGVQFGVGLDEGAPGTTDDVLRLDTDSYRRRMEDYTGSSPAFDLEGKVEIVGIRNN